MEGSHAIHYENVYVMFMECIRDENNTKKASAVVRQKLLETCTVVQLLDLRKECNAGGLKERVAKLNPKELNNPMAHFLVSKIITKCAALQSKHVMEMKQVTDCLMDGSLDDALEAAREMSLDNPERLLAFTKLARIYLSSNKLVEAESVISDVPSDKVRAELLGYLQILKKEPRDVGGYILQLNLIDETMHSEFSLKSSSDAFTLKTLPEFIEVFPKVNIPPTINHSEFQKEPMMYQDLNMLLFCRLRIKPPPHNDKGKNE